MQVIDYKVAVLNKESKNNNAYVHMHAWSPKQFQRNQPNSHILAHLN